MENQNNIPVVISVTDPSTNISQLDTHTLYNIKGKDNNGVIDVQRRFKDFVALREILVHKWPGCYIPGLPGRKLFQGTDIKMVNSRQKFLNSFCQKLSTLPHLFYSQEVNEIFLRSKEKDIYKILEQIPKPIATEIIQRYQRHFGSLQGKDIDVVLQKKVEDFVDNVRKNQQSLKLAKKYVKETVQSQEALNKQLDTIMNTSIPEYEKSYTSMYCGQQPLIFNHPDTTPKLNNELKANIIFKRINLDLYLDLVKLELKDCKAFLQMYKTKIEYEEYKKKLEQKGNDLQIEYQNVLAGKQSLINMFKRASVDEIKNSIQQQITSNNNEIDTIKNLNDIILAIIGFLEIDRYQQDKKQQYEIIIQKIQQLEQESIDEQTLYWKFIQDHSRQILQDQISKKQQKELNENQQQEKIEIIQQKIQEEERQEEIQKVVPQENGEYANQQQQEIQVDS
ncbi:hypothetical protein pb186bvf_000986 [Paramecium bursaria]